MPIFLTRPQVERLHDEALRRWGGLSGVRNSDLIDSALASAQNALCARRRIRHCGRACIPHRGVAGFLDGNKRTGDQGRRTPFFLEPWAGIRRYMGVHDDGWQQCGGGF